LKLLCICASALLLCASLPAETPVERANEAERLIRGGKQQEGLAALANAAELPGASAESEDRIGFLFAVLGRQSEAVTHFEKSISLKQEYAPAHYHLGVARWLAKEMAKGIMPEEQRANLRNGRWDADWHLRIGRRREDFLAELNSLSRDARMAAMFDIPRLQAALENWADETPTDLLSVYGPEFAVPRALLTARFIKYVEGQNQ